MPFSYLSALLAGLLLFALTHACAAQTVAETDPIAEELAFANGVVHALVGEHKEAVEAIAVGPNSDVATLFAHAVWLLENGDVALAAIELERVRAMADAPVQTTELLAVAYLHLDELYEAESLVQEILYDNPDNQFAHYLAGVIASRSQDDATAQAAFQLAGYTAEEANHIQLAVMQLPVDSAQRLATVREPTTQRYITPPDLGRADSGRIFNFTMLTAYEYDSNVPLRPTFQGLGSGFGHEDSRFLLASFADLKLLDRELFNVGLVASTYNTFQHELSNFNIEDYMGGAYSNLLLTDGLVGALRYEFHTTLVNGSQFSNEHRLTPSITRLGEFGHTTFFSEFNPIDNRAPSLISAQNQTADTYRFGATQALYTFDGDGRIYGGYQYSKSFAVGSDFDRASQMLTARLEQPLYRGWIGDLDVRYFWDDYESPNSLDFFERVRDDERVEVRAGLQKNCVNLPISLRLDYTFINNNSNTENLYGVHFYDYDRHVLSTQMIFSIY